MTEFKKAACKALVQRFENYKTKSLDELQKIKPRWACDKNADKVLDQQQTP